MIDSPFDERQYIGHLLREEEIDRDEMGYGKEKIFINKNNALQYMVKADLLPLDSNENAMGYIDSFDDRAGINDDLYKSDSERIGEFESKIGNKLLLYYYKRYSPGDYKKIAKVNIVDAPSELDDAKYYSIPVFMSNNDRILCQSRKSSSYYNRINSEYEFETYSEFEKNIKDGSYVGKVHGYNQYPDFTPIFVAWRDETGLMYAVGEISQMNFDPYGKMKLESQGNIKIPLKEYLNLIIYHPEINPSIMFVSEKAYNIIANEIAKKTMPKQKPEKYDSGVDDNKHSEKIKTGENRDKDNHLIEIDTSDKTDELLVKLMDYHSQKQDLFYNIKDLINFHTAVKSSKLVILSGLSGIGKSKIVDVYARALGIISGGSDDRLLFVPVRPSWNDDADLLGYVDLVHMVYRPSDTGFVDFLVRSQERENQDKLFIVCFDEMNLARVEHYFSQFISILERTEGQRELQLYDDKYTGRLYNYATYPSKIKIGDNIHFIGTVNIDESTHHFSDKVLDRANVIELDVLNYAQEWNKRNYGSVLTIVWSKEDYKKITRSDEILSLRIREMLWEMHTLMQSASSKYGIGPRIVRAIGKYLKNIPMIEKADFDVKQGIDYQIAQRVLTKVRGPENQVSKILNPNSEENFMKIFDKYTDVSDFKKSRKIVLEKQKELESYGYCI